VSETQSGRDDRVDFAGLWPEAIPFARYLDPDMKHFGLWEGVYRRAGIPDWALERGRALAPLRLLVIAEDWCGDAVNTVPVLAAWADAVAGLELRILKRDSYPRVMDTYLTNGTRSIPIAIGLDSSFHELGHWGPRPAELQGWVLANRGVLPKDRLYPETRRWYARDHGESTLREVIEAISGRAV
jgi:Thioredoxin